MTSKTKIQTTKQINKSNVKNISKNPTRKTKLELNQETQTKQKEEKSVEKSVEIKQLIDSNNTKSIQNKSDITKLNQIQTYKSNLPAVKEKIEEKLPLPNFDILLEITKLNDQISYQTLKLEQKQLQLAKTKDEYHQKLLNEEKSIRTRIVTIKKRQNIADVVEQIRQSELNLQNKLRERIEQYKPAQTLNTREKNNLFLALINKVTNVQ